MYGNLYKFGLKSRFTVIYINLSVLVRFTIHAKYEGSQQEQGPPFLYSLYGSVHLRMFNNVFIGLSLESYPKRVKGNTPGNKSSIVKKV